MQVSLSIDPDIYEPFWAIAIVTVVFLIYHFITISKGYKKSIIKYFGKKRAKIQAIVIQRLLGVFFFGMVTFISGWLVFNKPLFYYGINIHDIYTSLIWIAGLAPFIILMNFLNSKKTDNLMMYPQIRKKKWTRGLFMVSALSWIAYLAAYEFMFRGFLLFSCFYAFGTTMAIVINVCIYALVHVPKGVKEAVGAIPLGIILCVLTIKTESILIAITVHIIMALTNEWFSLRAHPEMKIKNKK